MHIESLGILEDVFVSVGRLDGEDDTLACLDELHVESISTWYSRQENVFRLQSRATRLLWPRDSSLWRSLYGNDRALPRTLWREMGLLSDLPAAEDAVGAG